MIPSILRSLTGLLAFAAFGLSLCPVTLAGQSLPSIQVEAPSLPVVWTDGHAFSRDKFKHAYVGAALSGVVYTLAREFHVPPPSAERWAVGSSLGVAITKESLDALRHGKVFSILDVAWTGAGGWASARVARWLLR